jgi:hypothetical protein
MTYGIEYAFFIIMVMNGRYSWIKPDCPKIMGNKMQVSKKKLPLNQEPGRRITCLQSQEYHRTTIINSKLCKVLRMHKIKGKCITTITIVLSKMLRQVLGVTEVPLQILSGALSIRKLKESVPAFGLDQTYLAHILPSGDTPLGHCHKLMTLHAFMEGHPLLLQQYHQQHQHNSLKR